MLQMVNVIVQPLLSNTTCQRQFLGSHHPRKRVTLQSVICFVKEYLAARVAQDSNGEEIVDEAG